METVQNDQAMSFQFGENKLVYSPKTDLMMVMMMMMMMMMIIIIIIIVIIIFTALSMTESNKSLTRTGFEFIKTITYRSSEREKLNQSMDYNIHYLIKLKFNETVPIGLGTWATGKQFAQNLGANPSPACRLCHYWLCSAELKNCIRKIMHMCALLSLVYIFNLLAPEFYILFK